MSAQDWNTDTAFINSCSETLRTLKLSWDNQPCYLYYEAWAIRSSSQYDPGRVFVPAIQALGLGESIRLTQLMDVRVRALRLGRLSEVRRL